jgi:hypothetical protein
MVDLKALAAPLDPDKVDWRIGSTTQDKSKGMALAYIDSRTVMERLDEVCGPEGWQCEYPHAGAKTSCQIGIKIDDEWVWKGDGAGDTDFEGDKGAFSDAFKRAAVKWGIGRYLYDLKAPWVAIEQKGRTTVIKKSEMPTLHALLKPGRPEPQNPVIGPLTKTALEKRLREFAAGLVAVEDSDSLAGLLQSYKDVLEQCKLDAPRWWDPPAGSETVGLCDRIADKKAELEQREVMLNPVPGAKFDPAQQGPLDDKPGKELL